MTSASFISAASVVVLLAGVALLAVVSASTLVPFAGFGRRRGLAFLGCLVGIWAVAVLVIVLMRMRHTI